MNVKYYGILMILIGLFMTISAIKKSDFVIYQILVSKSRKLWGDNVHRFYQIVGIMIIVVGTLVPIGIF